ncbi:MAG: aminomethyltransferase family protein [Alphaproteobacteria bacterium]|nr:aminomethyltransferase family protein [Alphaproteobacteria bacterium]
MKIRATPFHARAARENQLNVWEPREGFTLASHYGEPEAEALAAHLTSAFADISWRWRAMLEGARVEEYLARLVTKNPAKLAPGEAFKAAWLTDKGGVRGAGVIARHGRESFVLTTTAADREWIAQSAALFDVSVREPDEGGLAIVGRYAAKIVEAAGLDPALEPLKFRKSFWRGADVTCSRFGEHGGYEIWCAPDDALLVWDRIAKAGQPFALKAIGVQAMDILDLEAGVPRPDRDYEPARDGFAASPTPWELGLESLVDIDHTTFNGRAAALAAPRDKTRVGIAFDGETPRPRAPVKGGRTLSSLYSPALKRAIALAVVDTAQAMPGTELGGGARVAALPFLTVPDQIAE